MAAAQLAVGPRIGLNHFHHKQYDLAVAAADQVYCFACPIPVHFVVQKRTVSRDLVPTQPTVERMQGFHPMVID
ncbi:MAG: hypothetical protein NVSMB33_03420 [Ktedonobacteraceae bacterium]